jgi:hypothetical protein
MSIRLGSMVYRTAYVLYLDDLVERLQTAGLYKEANELDEALHASWTTSSEWLGEIKLALLNVSIAGAAKLSNSMRDEINEFVAFVDQAWNTANG